MQLMVSFIPLHVNIPDTGQDSYLMLEGIAFLNLITIVLLSPIVAPPPYFDTSCDWVWNWLHSSVLFFRLVTLAALISFLPHLA